MRRSPFGVCTLTCATVDDGDLRHLLQRDPARLAHEERGVPHCGWHDAVRDQVLAERARRGTNGTRRCANDDSPRRTPRDAARGSELPLLANLYFRRFALAVRNSRVADATDARLVNYAVTSGRSESGAFERPATHAKRRRS
jgi:hypothetical protein